jgi:hypothetical protein
MIAKWKMPVLAGGAVLLASCAAQPPQVYQYQPPPAYYYQQQPQAYYVPRVAPPAPRTYTPTRETEPARPRPNTETEAAKPHPKTETETARRERAPVYSLPPSADDCKGWWRICHFL